VEQVRREAAPGIFWSAVTTSGAFLLLNLSHLPGLAQLGSLVAIGIAIAAIVMLDFYLPPLMERAHGNDTTRTGNEPRDSESPTNGVIFLPLPGGEGRGEGGPRSHNLGRADRSLPKWYPKFIWSITLLVALAGAILLLVSPPRFDRSSDSLRPKHSQAYAALAEIKVRMNQPQEPQWLVVRGRDERTVAERLRKVEPVLHRAVSNGLIASVTLPTQLWPQPDHQATNRPTAAWLASQKDILKAAVVQQGFTPESFRLTDQLLATWASAAAATNVFWPGNENSHWILEKLTAHRAGEFLAIGLIHPSTNSPAGARSGLIQLAGALPPGGVLLSGWEVLGASISQMVIDDLPRVIVPIGIVVLISLWLAFRRVRDVVLSIATLALSGVLLTLIMTAAGWSWNMMNLMALPLLPGMGVDFSIHMQLALRRSGDVGFVRRSVGRALLLAGATTVAGFASLGLASNAGIAALGKVCAAGILCAMLTAIYLLPIWWTRFGGGKAGTR
jgi:predicted exporter